MLLICVVHADGDSMLSITRTSDIENSCILFNDGY